MQIAVGGCLAQKDRAEITRRAPWVDVVFGTHNIGSLPALLERARVNREAQVEILESLEVFPSTLPTRRESAYAAWVAISVGCNNTCTFCIVPSLRGTEKDRRPGDVLAEVEALVAEGVIEVTLLGQNVNSYGVGFGDRLAFGKLLRGLRRDRRARAGPLHVAAPARLHRRRDRRDGRDAERDAVAAHAAAVGIRPGPQGDASFLPARALPRDPRPGPRRDARGRDHDRHHRRLPRRDRGRLPADPRRRPRGAVQRSVHVPVLASAPAPPPRRWPTSCRTRSSRSATSASSSVVNEIAWDENKRSSVADVEVLVAEGEGRKDGHDSAAVRSCPRQPARALHPRPVGARVRPGDMVEVEVTYGAPHHLVSDVPVDVSAAYASRRRVGAAHVGTDPARRRVPRDAERRCPDPLPSLDTPACSAP